MSNHKIGSPMGKWEIVQAGPMKCVPVLRTTPANLADHAAVRSHRAKHAAGILRAEFPPWAGYEAVGGKCSAAASYALYAQPQGRLSGPILYGVLRTVIVSQRTDYYDREYVLCIVYALCHFVSLHSRWCALCGKEIHPVERFSWLFRHKFPLPRGWRKLAALRRTKIK